MCAPKLVPLPSTAQEIADVIGREATLAIASKASNRCIYVPRGDAPEHWIARLIGLPLFEKLQHEFGGMQLPIAKCSEIARAERKAGVIAMYHDGRTINDIAFEFDCTPRFVAMLLDGMTDGRAWAATPTPRIGSSTGVGERVRKQAPTLASE